MKDKNKGYSTWTFLLLFTGFLIFVLVISLIYNQYSYLNSDPVIVATKNIVQAPVVATIIQSTPTSTLCDNNTLAKLIIVNINAQHIYACEQTALVYDSPVTTGASELGDATPTGTFHILAMQRATPPNYIHLTGCDSRDCWNDPVQYWIPFSTNLEYGFHDASWQTFPFGGDLYPTEGSHGCVHMPLKAIEWLYSWATVGTTVQIS